MEEAGDRPGAGRDPTEREVRIMLVDDHEIVRAGLRLLLEAEAGFTVVEEAGDLEPALRRVAAQRPDVLVLDVQLPGGSSIAVIPRLRELSPDTRIVMLTMQGDLEAARQALGAGATGYVVKEAARSELIAAVRLAAAGRTYLHPELGAQLVQRRGEMPAAPDDLTRRELEVLRLIALGHTNSEIAGQLFLSVRTVESHRAHIQQKTGRATRAELVAYAREHGLAG